MGNLIFRNILECKIDVFANTFGNDSTSLFKRNDKLIHPLEYGSYRERCFKELLKIIVNKTTGVADGFVITALESISTQCDVIIYQSDTIPLIDNGIANFFPVEIVNGIGEIKSNLNKSMFKEALRKLANNKMLAAERKGSTVSLKGFFKENDEILSFLVCNKLMFDINALDFDEIYLGIPIIYRHNAILSLEDGLISYELNFNEMPPIMKERFISLNGDINHKNVIWEYPVHKEGEEEYKCPNLFVKAKPDDKYNHIIHFLTILKAILNNQYQYNFDFTEYLDLNTDSIFK